MVKYSIKAASGVPIARKLSGKFIYMYIHILKSWRCTCTTCTVHCMTSTWHSSVGIAWLLYSECTCMLTQEAIPKGFLIEVD